MKTVNEELADWAIKKIMNNYKDDVCLLVAHDTFKLEKDKSGTSMSFFVPATEKALELAKTFIVDGIGYDLFPMSWERLERLANLDDSITSCLGDAQLLYCRNPEDKEHFVALQKKLQENLKNQEFLFRKALEKINIAMEIYKTMMFEESIGKIRKAAGYIVDFLANAVACTNQTYFKNGQTNQITDLLAMKYIPEDFINLYKAVVTANSTSDLKKICYQVIYSTREFLRTRKPSDENRSSSKDLIGLANWYQELCYTWRRIYYWCEEKDMVRTFMWGCFLQSELDIVKEEFGLDEMDLLVKFNANDLMTFRKQAEAIESYIIEIIQGNGVKLDTYDSVDDFIKKNS
jgi:hypothetical protein